MTPFILISDDKTDLELLAFTDEQAQTVYTDSRFGGAFPRRARAFDHVADAVGEYWRSRNRRSSLQSAAQQGVQL